MQAINSAAVGAKLERKGRPTPRSGVGLSVQASLLQQPRARLFFLLFSLKAGRTSKKKLALVAPFIRGKSYRFTGQFSEDGPSPSPTTTTTTPTSNTNANKQHQQTTTTPTNNNNANKQQQQTTTTPTNNTNDNTNTSIHWP